MAAVAHRPVATHYGALQLLRKVDATQDQETTYALARALFTDEGTDVKRWDWSNGPSLFF